MDPGSGHDGPVGLLKGRYGIQDLVDLGTLKSTLAEFSTATGFCVGLISHPEGELLFSAGCHTICRDFHHPESGPSPCCQIGYATITDDVSESRQWQIMTCEHGLSAAAIPIVVQGKHLASLFTCQILLTEPDLAEFRRRAEGLDLDPEQYLAHLRDVPVVEEPRLRSALAFLADVVVVYAEQGLASAKAQQRTEELATLLAEARNTRAELRRSDAHLRTLVDTLPDMVWLKDPDGIYLACNPRFEEFFGATEAEIVGQTDYDFVDSDLAEFFRANDRAAIAAGGPRVNEEEVTFADDGHTELLETIKTPMYDASGVLVGVLGIARDITERRRAAQERERLQDQLNQARKMESVGRLAGSVAHDLNNLLSPILGFSELLLDDLALNDTRRTSVERIVSAGNRARDLVFQLLAFSRKQPLAFRPLDLNRTIANFRKLLRRTIPEDIEIRLRLTADANAILGDLGQIEQVLMNLAANGADAMPDGGTLTIATAAVNLDEAYAAAHPDVRPGPHVLLTVSDTGHGMDAEVREHIFEPFYSTKGDLGTGLGLATVYGIVTQHGGHINVTSEPGTGTTFKIYLPATDRSVAPVVDVVVEPGALTGHERIMLVEDDEHVCLVTEAILQRQGYHVDTARCGSEALAHLAASDVDYDLLLTDVIMPDLNGKELYDRARRRRPRLRVLYMSGYTGDIIAQRGVLEDGISFVQKPFTVEALATKVREVLRAAQAAE